MEDFDLNALHEMLFDKSRQKEPAKQTIVQHPAPQTSVSNTQHLQKHHETDKDLDHFASMMENAGFDFDFNEAAEHAEKSFDPLKFLMNSMNAGPTRDSPEPNQAELEPVQVTVKLIFVQQSFLVHSTRFAAKSLKNGPCSVNFCECE
jgi:hypothetical protein